MRALFSLCGYDTALIDRVGAGERAFFIASAALSVAACGLAGAGMAYGATLTLGALIAPIAFVATCAFVLNLLRLQHAGSGYPLHLPVEQIHAWRPATAGIVILLVFGALIGQPLVFLVEKRWLDPVIAARVADAGAVRAALGQAVDPLAGAGLITRGRVAWEDHAALSAGLTALVAVLVASPAIARRLGVRVVRHYESARWIADRTVVDDEWATARDVIEAVMRSAPT